MAEKIPTPQSEEVDLGKLFQIIGNGFKKIFSSIGDLFKALFHYGILSLLFLKKHAIVLGLATILGGVLGYVLTMGDETQYKSEMILETNFGSGHQLYRQNMYLNSLIGKEDAKTLSEIFSLSDEEAQSLTGFSVEPQDKPSSLLTQFDYYMQHTDTIFTRELTVQGFGKRLQNPDYRKQKITASATNQEVFSKLSNGITNLVENKHFKELLKAKMDDITSRKKVLEKNIIQMDSVRKRYDKVAILSAANNTSNGTNISLSEKAIRTTKDVELFRESTETLENLGRLNAEQLRNNFITTIVSEFGFGNVDDRFWKQKWFQYAALGFLLSLMGILGLKLNTYLNNYKK